MMDYFRIRRDNESCKKMFVEGISRFTESSKIYLGHVNLLPDAIMLTVRSSEYNIYTDVMSDQVFMVKENIFTVMLLFDEDLEYRCMYLSDKKCGELHYYYVPIIPLSDCFSEKSVSNVDKSVVSKTVIKDLPDYPDIFRVANIDDNIIVVSLDMAEAILRRKPFGVKLEKVAIEK